MSNIGRSQRATHGIEAPVFDFGMAGWQTRLSESLPKHLRGKLPTIRQIEAELKGVKGVGDGA